MLSDNKDGQEKDLLQVFDSITVNNKEKIPGQDHQFCQKQQTMLSATLDNLAKWYGLFHQETELCKELFDLEFNPDGSLGYNFPYDRYPDIATNYHIYNFLPFEHINKIVALKHAAIQKFAHSIVRHFNKKYDVSVPDPDIDELELPAPYIPDYMVFVEIVVNHLGGRNFRQTAEEELIRKLHLAVCRYEGQKKPTLKANTIQFYNLISWNGISLKNKNYCIDYGYEDYLYTLCNGLIFFNNGNFDGGEKSILAFRKDKVETTHEYSLNTTPAICLSFDKRRKVEVRFESVEQALACYSTLKLNEI